MSDDVLSSMGGKTAAHMAVRPGAEDVVMLLLLQATSEKYAGAKTRFRSMAFSSHGICPRGHPMVKRHGCMGNPNAEG